jgi:hypothetical protein
MSADRYEDSKVVLIPDDGGEALILDRAAHAISVGDVVDVTLEDGKITALVLC